MFGLKQVVTHVAAKTNTDDLGEGNKNYKERLLIQMGKLKAYIGG